MEARDLLDERAQEVTVTSEPHRGVATRVFTYAAAGPAGTTALRAVTVVLVVAGAALAVASGAVHIKLWSDGYRTIPTIGPLFLFQGIVGILLGVVLVAWRRLAAVVATAGFMVATIGGLLLSVYVGLFGFTDTFAAPYAGLSLAIEVTGAVVLFAAALVLAWGAASGRSKSYSAKPG